MALVLAIESDAVQADPLRRLLRARADTDVVIVGSKDAAVSAVDERVPDLVLVGALMSPRDEDALIAHLRTLPDAGHLQTLTIPKLRRTSGKTRRGVSIFGKRKKQQTDEIADGCDPTQFGDEVAAYLARACEVKAEIEQRKAAALELEAGTLETDHPEPVAARSSVSDQEPSHQDTGLFYNSGSDPESAQKEREALPQRAPPNKRHIRPSSRRPRMSRWRTATHSGPTKPRPARC